MPGRAPGSTPAPARTTDRERPHHDHRRHRSHRPPRPPRRRGPARPRRARRPRSSPPAATPSGSPTSPSAACASRRADFDDPASLEAAFAGVDRLLLVSGTEIGQRVAQHRAVDRGRRGRPASSCSPTRASPTPTPPRWRSPPSTARPSRSSRDVGRAVHLPAQQLVPRELHRRRSPAYLEHGVVGSAGDGRVSAATRADYAEPRPPPCSTPTVTPAASTSSAARRFTLAELAATVAEASGARSPHRGARPRS